MIYIPVLFYDLAPHSIVGLQEGRRFLASCFEKNPVDRPSAQELLLHPWIQKVTSVYQPNEVRDEIRHHYRCNAKSKSARTNSDPQPPTKLIRTLSPNMNTSPLTATKRHSSSDILHASLEDMIQHTHASTTKRRNRSRERKGLAQSDPQSRSLSHRTQPASSRFHIRTTILLEPDCAQHERNWRAWTNNMRRGRLPLLLSLLLSSLLILLLPLAFRKDFRPTRNPPQRVSPKERTIIDVVRRRIIKETGSYGLRRSQNQNESMDWKDSVAHGLSLYPHLAHHLYSSFGLGPFLEMLRDLSQPDGEIYCALDIIQSVGVASHGLSPKRITHEEESRF